MLGDSSGPLGPHPQAKHRQAWAKPAVLSARLSSPQESTQNGERFKYTLSPDTDHFPAEHIRLSFRTKIIENRKRGAVLMGKDRRGQGPSEALSPPLREWFCRAVLPLPAAGVTARASARAGEQRGGSAPVKGTQRSGVTLTHSVEG